jgi:hypothetical protein
VPEKSSSKRKYIRLSGSAWAEIEGLWESGDATLQDLEQRYGVSRRSLQTHFAKRGIVKGAQAAQLAAAVKQQVFTENLADPDLITNRAVETRETAYRNAVVIEGLIMGQLDIAQKDPLLALRAAGAIKGLTLAAAGLERLHALKWRALGLDKDSLQGDELPVLVFEDLTPAEITAIQQGGDADDPDDPTSSPVSDEDDNEVIFENCNDGEDDGRTEPPVVQKGPRLVRGAV